MLLLQSLSRPLLAGEEEQAEDREHDPRRQEVLLVDLAEEELAALENAQEAQDPQQAHAVEEIGRAHV